MTQPTSGRTRKRLYAAFSALIVVAVLGVLLWRERDALAGAHFAFRWQWLAGGVGLMLVGLAATALVWAGIVRSLGSQLPWLRHAHIFVSTYLSRYLPGTLWYVVGRGVMYRDLGESVRLVSTASAVELAVTVVAGATTAALALLVVPLRALPGQAPTALLALLPALAVGLALLHPAVLRRIFRLLKLEAEPRVRLRDAVPWVVIYVLMWVLGAAILYLNARMVVGADAPLPWAYLLLVWSLVGTLSYLMVFLPSNFGFTELGLSLLLSTVMPSSQAVVVAVFSRLLMTLYAVVAALALTGATGYWLRKR